MLRQMMFPILCLSRPAGPARGPAAAPEGLVKEAWMALTNPSWAWGDLGFRADFNQPLRGAGAIWAFLGIYCCTTYLKN